MSKLRENRENDISSTHKLYMVPLPLCINNMNISIFFLSLQFIYFNKTKVVIFWTGFIYTSSKKEMMNQELFDLTNNKKSSRDVRVIYTNHQNYWTVIIRNCVVAASLLWFNPGGQLSLTLLLAHCTLTKRGRKSQGQKCENL